MTFTIDELLIGQIANLEISLAATTPEEALDAATLAHTLSIAAMMLEEDLDDLLVASR